MSDGIRLHFYPDDDSDLGVGDVIGGPQVGVPTHCVVECAAGWLQIDLKKCRWKPSDPFPTRSRITVSRQLSPEQQAACVDALSRMIGRKYDKSRLVYCWARRRIGKAARALRGLLVHWPSRVICVDGPLVVFGIIGDKYPQEWQAASVASVMWHALDTGLAVDSQATTVPPAMMAHMTKWHEEGRA